MHACSFWHVRPLLLTTGSLSIFLFLLLGFSAASAQVVPLPFSASGVTLSTAQPEAVFTVDLDTLPIRPRLVSEVTPDAPFVDMAIETEWICDLDCFEFSLYDDGSGCAEEGDCVFCETAETCVGEDPFYSNEVYECSPYGSRAGAVCNVIVRATSFGGNGSPATVNVEIYGETAPPTDTQSFVYPPVPEVLPIAPNQDTTIYEDSVNSNGGGEFIWSGFKVNFLLPSGTETLRRNGLLSFDLVEDQFSTIPAGSTINDVELILEATEIRVGPLVIDLHAVENNASVGLSSWREGAANAPDDEFEGAFSFPSATWLQRGSPQPEWNTPGGDLETPRLVRRTISAPGPVSFSSPSLTAKVQEMVDSGDDRNGFLLRAPISVIPPTNTANLSKGVQFASVDNANASIRPRLIVDFTAPVGGPLLDVTLPFFSEGQNFRWIYDISPTDAVADGVLTTPIGGQCVAELDPLEVLNIPYTYDYGGDPTYQGVDCCTWRITAQGDPGTSGDEIIGTGQALFFVNLLNPLDPANQPGDLDEDGIKDLCDNCMWRPNGPALGTCVGGPSEGIHCNANETCGLGGTCHLSQEDSDLDYIGDACLVPEPGFVSMLLSGVGGLIAVRRSSRLREFA